MDRLTVNSGIGKGMYVCIDNEWIDSKRLEGGMGGWIAGWLDPGVSGALVTGHRTGSMLVT